MDAKQAIIVQGPSGTKVSDEFPASVSVLLVDADSTASLVLQNIMKQYSYQVTSSHSAEEALSHLRRDKNKFNIVIWDLNMPGTDELEALKTITSEMDLPVIVMSTGCERESVKKAIMDGACEYLVKPVSKETIAVLWQHMVRKNNQTGLDHEVGSLIDPKINLRGRCNDEESSKGVVKAPVSKKHRMTWNENLHRKFLEAVNRIGIDKAVPKQILKCMQEMKVQGLTRNNIASHLQKYRLSRQRNNRFAQETPDYKLLTEPNPSASKPSSLINQSNILHTFLSNHVMNSMAPQLPNSYITTNNTFMNNPQPLPHYTFNDHLIYPSLQLPNPKAVTEELGHPLLGGGHHELIDTSLFDYGLDVLEDPFTLQ